MTKSTPGQAAISGSLTSCQGWRPGVHTSRPTACAGPGVGREPRIGGRHHRVARKPADGDVVGMEVRRRAGRTRRQRPGGSDRISDTSCSRMRVRRRRGQFAVVIAEQVEFRDAEDRRGAPQLSLSHSRAAPRRLHSGGSPALPDSPRVAVASTTRVPSLEYLQATPPVRKVSSSGWAKISSSVRPMRPLYNQAEPAVGAASRIGPAARRTGGLLEVHDVRPGRDSLSPPGRGSPEAPPGLIAQYLQGLKQQGFLLCSGPLEPRFGGAAVLRLPDDQMPDILDTIRDDDPVREEPRRAVGSDGLERRHGQGRSRPPLTAMFLTTTLTTPIGPMLAVMSPEGLCGLEFDRPRAGDAALGAARAVPARLETAAWRSRRVRRDHRVAGRLLRRQVGRVRGPGRARPRSARRSSATSGTS